MTIGRPRRPPVGNLFSIACKICKRALPLHRFQMQRNKARGWTWWNSACIDCKNAALIKKTRERKLALVEALGGKCVDCGITDDRVLMAHHVDEKGKADRDEAKRRRGGSSRMAYYAMLLRKAKRNRKALLLLCANCHMIRHHGRPNFTGSMIPDRNDL